MAAEGMKVEASIVTHPKFLRLKKAVGDYAMEALVRMWAHCEGGQKGEYWKGADADYLEAVTQWDGEPGKLFTALVNCRWVEKHPRGIRIHDWAAHNWRRVVNWKLGPKGGRRKANPKPETVNPKETLGLATGSTPLNELSDLNELSEVKANNNGVEKQNSEQLGRVEASKARFVALRDRIEKLSTLGDDATPIERAELRKKRRELEELQKNQAEGKF